LRVLWAASALAVCLGCSSGAEDAREGTQGIAAPGTASAHLTGVAACNAVDAGTCVTSSDCPSGLCLTRHSGRVCVPACDDATPCPTGMECEWRHTGAGLKGYCVPKERGWTP
jgi:hypothetical protein